jgi:putative FmdB family regulatory protein
MPNYDYQCDACGHRFEVFQRMSDAKLEDCPVDGCGGRIRRLLGTGAGLIFKGSGFYQTDYRSSGYQEAAKGESGGGKAAAETAQPAAAKAGGCGGGCACASH